MKNRIVIAACLALLYGLSAGPVLGGEEGRVRLVDKSGRTVTLVAPRRVVDRSGRTVLRSVRTTGGGVVLRDRRGRTVLRTRREVGRFR